VVGFRVHESFAALMEIQRVWRGAATRCFLLLAKKARYAVLIQRIYRGHHSQVEILRRRAIRNETRAARKIAKQWRNFVWERKQTEIRVLKRRRKRYEAVIYAYT
jgi:hypothetical protein